MPKEEWRDIAGYEGWYQVSDLGRVRSVDRSVKYSNGKIYNYKGKVLKLYSDKDGYKTATLSVNQNLEIKKVHRLVCEAFLVNVENKSQVNHIDGVKYNNLLENLEWSTQSENQRHAVETGLRISPTGEESKSSKFSNWDILFIRHWLGLGMTQRNIAKAFNVHFASISLISLGKTWSHVK